MIKMRKILFISLSLIFAGSVFAYSENAPEASAGQTIIVHNTKAVQERCDFDKEVVVAHGTYPYEDDFICVQKAG